MHELSCNIVSWSPETQLKVIELYREFLHKVRDLPVAIRLRHKIDGELIASFVGNASDFDEQLLYALLDK